MYFTCDFLRRESAHTETYHDYVYDKRLSGLTEKTSKYTVEATSPWDEEQENYSRTYYTVFPLVVGGKVVPINVQVTKPELNVPWVWLSTIILAVLLSVAYVKTRKKR